MSVKLSGLRKFRWLALLASGIAMMACLMWYAKHQKNHEITHIDSDQPPRTKTPRNTRETTGDVLSLVKYFPENASAEQRSKFTTKLDDSIAELSKERLIEQIQTYQSSENITEQILLSRLLRSLYAMDPQHALDLYAGANIALGGLGVDMLEDAIQINRADFIQWLSNGKLEVLSGDVLQSFFIVLGRCKMGDALGIIKNQNTAMGSRLAMMFFQNYGGAMEDAENLAKNLDGSVGANAVIGIIQRYQKKYPEQCYDLFISQRAQDSENRPLDDHVFMSIFKSLFTSNAEGAIGKLDDVEVSRLQKLLSNKDVLSAAIQYDSTKAMGLLNKIIPTKSNSQLFTDAINLFAQKAPEATFKMTLGMAGSDSAMSSALVTRAMEIWAQKDAVAAREAYLSLPQEERNGAVEGLAKADALHWKGDPAQMMAWAKNLGADEYSKYICAASEFIAWQDPKSASDLLLNAAKGEMNSARLNQASHDVGQKYANRLGVASALQWVTDLPVSMQPKAMEGVIEHWMAADPGAASEWISKQTPGPSRDAAVGVLIKQIKDTDPTAAEQWRKSLTQPANGRN